MFRTRITLVSGLLLASLLFVGFLSGEDPLQAGDPPPCAFDDELEGTGSCCALTGISLPTSFPMVEQEIRYFTWNNCNLARNKTLCVELSPLELARDGEGDFIGCGTYDLPVSMRTCGQQAIPLFSGNLRATYARTWVEMQPTEDPETQVWRFMINGDLAPSAFLLDRYGTNPNLPQCQSEFAGQIHWFGYIDYRRDCSTFAWEVEWVLEHACDLYHHSAGSSRSGTHHPGRSFNFAGPSTFVPTTAYTLIDSNIWSSSPGIRQIEYNGNEFARCYRYDAFDEIGTAAGDPRCACGSAGVGQYVDTIVGSSTTCGHEFLGFGTIRKKLGYFEDPTFGQLRRVTMWFGPGQFRDACDPHTQQYFIEGVEVLNNTTENFVLTESGALIPVGPNFVELTTANDDMGGFLHGVPHFSRVHINFNR